MTAVLMGMLLASTAMITPRETACPYHPEAAVIDGALTEPGWQSAARLEDFTAVEPIEGAKPTQTTTALVWRDDTHLYVGVRAGDSETRKIRANLSRRDSMFDDDWVLVALDPYLDFQKAYLFFVNPLGVQGDGIAAVGQMDDDMSWDATFHTAGKVGEDGYTVEIAIPFSALKFSAGKTKWGLQIVRRIPRNGEVMAWSPVTADRNTKLEQVGVMRDMGGVTSGVRLELIPELTALISRSAGDLPAVFNRDNALVDVGGTARMTVGSGSSLDLALNPDFSQVESDAARITVNQRFALFFDEKRPFFLEGRELFVTPWQVVHTRTIANPIYGTKLTGKWGSTAVAVLHGLDESPGDSFVDSRWSSDEYGSKRAATSIVRSTSTVADTTSLGIIAAEKRVGSAWNRLGGLDFDLKLNSQWRLVNQTMFTATDYPNGDIESGFGYKHRLIRTGRHFSLFHWYEELSPEFRAEMGFIPRVGYRETGARLNYRYETGGKRLIAVNPHLWPRILKSTLNSDREVELLGGSSFRFPNGHIEANALYRAERFAGQPFERNNLDVGGAVEPTRWLSLNGGVAFGRRIFYDPDDPFSGIGLDIGAGFSLRPTESLSMGALYRRNWLQRRVGDTVFDASVLRASATWYPVQPLGFRIISDVSNITDDLVLEGLVSYQPRPNTAVYLGYTDAISIGPDSDTSNARALFLKISYLYSTP